MGGLLKEATADQRKQKSSLGHWVTVPCLDPKSAHYPSAPQPPPTVHEDKWDPHMPLPGSLVLSADDGPLTGPLAFAFCGSTENQDGPHCLPSKIKTVLKPLVRNLDFPYLLSLFMNQIYRSGEQSPRLFLNNLLLF